MMKLMFFPVNSAWGFVFGDDLRTASVIDIDGQRMFPSRDEAVNAARGKGLDVAKNGVVSVKEAQ